VVALRARYVSESGEEGVLQGNIVKNTGGWSRRATAGYIMNSIENF
jgi:hypothetical protein